MPSVISVWPGADLQEREVYDMIGIRFDGHPNLRRILLWDGFEGYPLRKDYKESYYEEDLKPFKSRHPDGQHQWAEDRVPVEGQRHLSRSPGTPTCGRSRRCSTGASWRWTRQGAATAPI